MNNFEKNNNTFWKQLAGDKNAGTNYETYKE